MSIRRKSGEAVATLNLNRPIVLKNDGESELPTAHFNDLKVVKEGEV